MKLIIKQQIPLAFFWVIYYSNKGGTQKQYNYESILTNDWNQCP